MRTRHPRPPPHPSCIRAHRRGRARRRSQRRRRAHLGRKRGGTPQRAPLQRGRGLLMTVIVLTVCSEGLADTAPSGCWRSPPVCTSATSAPESGNGSGARSSRWLGPAARYSCSNDQENNDCRSLCTTTTGNPSTLMESRSSGAPPRDTYPIRRCHQGGAKRRKADASDGNRVARPPQPRQQVNKNKTVDLQT
jgi:hypothetical protein